MGWRALRTIQKEIKRNNWACQAPGTPSKVRLPLLGRIAIGRMSSRILSSTRPKMGLQVLPCFQGQTCSVPCGPPIFCMISTNYAAGITLSQHMLYSRRRLANNAYAFERRCRQSAVSSRTASITWRNSFNAEQKSAHRRDSVWVAACPAAGCQLETNRMPTPRTDRLLADPETPLLLYKLG